MMRQVITPVARAWLRSNRTGPLCRKYGGSSGSRHTTMDDLPVPQGSWEANYKNNQQKYNLHLLLGIVFSGITIITAKTSGLVYLNSSLPSLKD